MIRLHDWQVRYSAYIAGRRAMPFAWGPNDCATFATGCVEAMTGVDIRPEDLRDLANAKDALRALESYGGLRGAFTSVLGEPRNSAMASVGDIVLITVGKRECAGICNGDVVFGPSDTGLDFLPTTEALCAWRIG